MEVRAVVDKIDFTNCSASLAGHINGGNGKKIAVEYRNAPYMLKFPPSGKEKPTELSYTNSCISEHISSSIFNMLEIRAHQTLLGTYEVNGSIKVVCACQDFTADGKRLLDFCSIKNTVIDSEHGGTGTEITQFRSSTVPGFLLSCFWRRNDGIIR